MRGDYLKKAVGMLVFGLALPVTPLATYNPTSSVSYSIGLPSSSAATTTTPGEVYLQLSCPTTYTWCALGLGTAMAQSSILVLYTSSTTNNVTLSARLGRGHVQPQQSTTFQSSIEMLEGSGVTNGMMVANAICKNCTLIDGGSGKSSWIAAWYEGTALASSSLMATINQHDEDDTRQFTFDSSAAILSTNTNPFVAGTGTATGTASAATSTGSGATTTGKKSKTEIHTLLEAHGIIMGVTVVLLFPLASIWMRLGGHWAVHAAVQSLGLICLIVGLGLGWKLALLTGWLFESTGQTHTIFGLTLIILFLLQPLLGLYHHHQYSRSGARNPLSHVHIWFGRILMLLAIINGGLGLKLAHDSRKGMIAYGVLAGVIGVAYLVLAAGKRTGKGMGGMRKESAADEAALKEGREVK